MHTYCVTFRIGSETVGGDSYAIRRKRLIDNIRVDGRGFWDGTTSFLIVEAPESTESFAQRACDGLSAKHDLIIVFDPDDMSMVHFGPVPEADILASFFRFAKKLV